jgi:Helix-turn-helix domain
MEDNNRIPFDFIPVPTEIARRLGGNTALVYGVIFFYASMENHACYASVKTMAARIGMNPKTFREQKDFLIETNWIEEVHRPGETSIIFVLDTPTKNGTTTNIGTTKNGYTPIPKTGRGVPKNGRGVYPKTAHEQSINRIQRDRKIRKEISLEISREKYGYSGNPTNPDEDDFFGDDPWSEDSISEQRASYSIANPDTLDNNKIENAALGSPF